MNCPDSMANFKIVPSCDYCIWSDAEAIIILEKGDCFQVCKEHIVPMIAQVADTDNPVHSIEEIE